MQLFENADTTYKTRDRAVAKLKKTIGDISEVQWLIAVNDEGRFHPVVRLHGEQMHLISTLAQQGICVM